MAGSIQGLTVIINGDATRLTKAMREARAEAGILRGHMSSLNKLLAFDPSSATLLTRQQQLLSASIMETQQRLAQLRASYSQLAPAVSSMSSAQLRQFMSLQKEITQTELRMAQLRQEAIQTGAAGSVAMHQWAGRFGSLSAALSKVSTQLVTASAASGLLGYAAVSAAAEFEGSFAGVRKTIVATEAEYEKLAADAIALSLVKPVDANDINRIMELGGQLNVASQHLTKFAGVMADLDVSTDMNIEEGSLKLAQFMNISNMAQSDVDRLGATIVDLGNNSATTEDRMMNMAMRIVGAGRNIGMSAQDVLGLAASLSAVGIQAEMGGNAISTIMNRIDKDVALNGSTLSTWAQTAGMTSQEFARAWESDVTGTFTRVVQGMGTFRDEGNNLNVLLKDMGISYMRQVDTMQRLSRSGDLMTSLIARANTAWGANTALVREATQRYSTAESKIQMMKNSVNAMGVAIGQQVLPAFSGLVENVAKAVQAFADMDDGAKEAAANVLLFVTAIGPAAKLVQGAAGGIQALLKGYMSLRTALNLAAAGQMTYTNMTIASNAATAAEAASRAANLAAMAQQQRGYVAILNAKAAEVAATGDSAAAEAIAAAARGLGAVAAETEAKAEGENAAATLANASSKGVLAAAIEVANAQAVVFGTTLAITNIELLGLVAVVAGLTIGLGLAAKGIADANDPMNRLTSSAQEQQDRINALKSELEGYEAAGEGGSAAALKCRAALDEETKSFEGAGLTVREFCENVREAANEQAELTGKLKDAQDAADAEAGNMLRLADQIEALSGSAGGSADDMQLMQTQIAALNTLVPELNLHFDSATGTLESAAGAWRDVVDKASDSKRYETAMTNLTTAQEAQAEALANLTAAQEEYNAAREAIPDNEQWIGYVPQGVAQALREATEAYNQASADVERYQRVVRETADQEAAYSDALARLATGQFAAADGAAGLTQAVRYLADAYGMEVAEGELAAEMAERQAAASQGTTASLSDLVDAIDEARGESEALDRAMLGSGASSEWLAGRIAELGVSADDAADLVAGLAEKATDGFNRLDESAGISLDDFLENLRHNAEATRQFSDNLAYLRQVASESGNLAALDMLNQLDAAGVEEGAAAVQQLADATRENGDALGEAAAGYAESIGIASEAAVGQFGDLSQAVTADTEEIAGAVDGGGSRVEQTVKSAAAAIADTMGQVIVEAQIKSKAAMDAYEQAIREGKAPEEAAAIAQRVADSLVIPDTSGIGRAALEGLRAGLTDGNLIAQIQSAAAAAADAARSAMAGAKGLDVNSPSRKTRRIGRSAAEGLELGIRDGVEDVRRASELLARSSLPRSARDGWAQVASTPWGAAALAGAAGREGAEGVARAVAAEMGGRRVGDVNVGVTVNCGPSRSPAEVGEAVAGRVADALEAILDMEA